VDLAEYGRMRQIAVRLSSRGRSLLATLVETGGNRWEQVDVYKVSRRYPMTLIKSGSFTLYKLPLFLRTLYSPAI